MPASPMTMLPLTAMFADGRPNLAAQQVDGCPRYGGRGVNPVAKAACDPKRIKPPRFFLKKGQRVTCHLSRPDFVSAGELPSSKQQQA